ncbi:hypothetical protein GEV33_002461 [Tenebrio molitor]|uniref:Uncharacterized protein n=1 Tax=Tenebrio molitor TaxID=7067 RepID=A0A8J6HKC6_TENMO|nr:hypothetical protein GEV33_002461 [Tenebrio molitor]
MARGLSITVNAPDDMHRGIGNPLSGMIADPDRHARNSHLATCGPAARSAVADRVLDFRSR